MREHIPKKILRQKWSINFFSKFQFFREFLQLDGTKNEAEALANNRCIWNQQWISAEPISVREKSKLTQNGEKNRNFFCLLTYTCFTLSRALPTRTSPL